MSHALLLFMRFEFGSATLNSSPLFRWKNSPPEKGSFECIHFKFNSFNCLWEQRKGKKSTFEDSSCVVIDTHWNGKRQVHRLIETRTHFNRFVSICAETQKRWKSSKMLCSPKSTIFKSMMAEVGRVTIFPFARNHQKNSNDFLLQNGRMSTKKNEFLMYSVNSIKFNLRHTINWKLFSIATAVNVTS